MRSVLQLSFALTLCFSFTRGAFAQKVLTLEEALALTRKAQPALRQARANTEGAQARITQARSGLLPQVDVSLGYSRSTANFAARPGAIPSSVSQGTTAANFNTYDFFTSGITLNQRVWDFGQTWNRYKSAQASAQSQEETERSVYLRSLFTVRSAFFAARAQKALLQVALETLESQQRHFEQIQAFVRAGTRPEIDVAQARTDLANAKVSLINSENSYRTAKAQLQQAMGQEGPAEYEVAEERLAEIPGEGESLDKLLTIAAQERPELKALAHQQQAQARTRAALWGEYFPAIGVSTGLTDNGRALGSLTWNWNAGVTLSWPLLQGGLTRGQVAEADASLRALEAQTDVQKQQVVLELTQAQLAVSAAKAALGATEEALVAARERLRLSEGRYRTGVGSIIELGDAQLAVTSAAAQQVSAEFQLSTARAQLLLSLGREG